MSVTKPAPPDLSKIASVQAIEIQFHTNDDDLDEDTLLTVTFMENNSVFATVQPNVMSGFQDLGLGATADDYSDGRTTDWISVPLQVGVRILKPSIHQCATKVRIDPTGDDTWRFNYWTRVHYTDGTMNEYHFDGHALSEKVRENTFFLR